MARTARFEMRIAPNLLDRIDAVRGDAPRTAYVERAVRMRLANDESGGSEQTVSVASGGMPARSPSASPDRAPSSGPSAATPSDVPEVEPEPAAPDPESHDEPEYERRPPPRMTGGRKAR